MRVLPLLVLLVGCSDNKLIFNNEDPVEILPGSIAGRVCDPSGRTWLADATAYVNIVDSDGVIYETRQVLTDIDGRWMLDELPGDVEYHLYVQFGSQILWEEEIYLGSGETIELDEPECYDPLSLRVAIVTGNYDNVDVVLDQLGFEDLTLVDGLNEAELDGFLGDPAALAGFDMVFFNGGHLEEGVVYDTTDAENPTVATNLANLRGYVEAGGTVFASDWAYDVVERMYPDRLEFVGADEVPDDAQLGDYDLVSASVSDTALAEYLGADRVDVQFDLQVWPPMESVSSSVSVHLNGTVPYSDGLSEYTLTAAPLLVSYNAGAGRVIFSTFRTVPNATDDIRATFEYMLYNL